MFSNTFFKHFGTQIAYIIYRRLTEFMQSIRVFQKWTKIFRQILQEKNMKLKTLFFAGLAALFLSTQAMALTVVYVHGTSPNMTKQDAYDYWNGGDHQNVNSAPAFVENSRNGKPYFISYRDGRAYIKPQAIQLANQIYSNVSDSQIIIVAHSMGGLIIRYIMANPTNDGLTSYQRYQFDTVRNKVRRIVTLATPHLGSPGADFTQSLRDNPLTQPLTSWLGYDKDAIEHLKTGYCKSISAGMLHPNNIKRSDGSRPHVYMLGSRDPNGGDSWYWTEWENVGLNAIDTFVNYNGNQMTPSKGSYYDQYPADNYCTDRAWWGWCYEYGDGDGELDNDGMVSAWSGNFGNYSNSYLHKYTSYHSHHTNRYDPALGSWVKNFIY